MIDEKIIKVYKAYRSFSYFLEEFVSPYVEYGIPQHVYEWASYLENNNKVSLVAPRLHLKSTTMYYFLLWNIFRKPGEDLKALYISYNHDLAAYHISEIKKVMEKIPVFSEFDHGTKATGHLSGSFGGGFVDVSPAGILTFKRGWHGDLVICDDILRDPTSAVNTDVINKITKLFFEEVFYLPYKGGRLVVVGTPQHEEDLFFQLKKREDWLWLFYTAYRDNGEPLFPERFSKKELQEMEEFNPHAFQKEMMCVPVHLADSFLDKEKVEACVDNNLPNEIKRYNGYLVAGWDIGKKIHPSHLAVFQITDDKAIQVLSRWYDRMDYTTQVLQIKSLVDKMGVSEVYFDNTRGELESFMETGVLPKRVFKPIVLNMREKFYLASNLERLINEGRVKLINDRRQINQLLNVNSELKSVETAEGHGDSFWSIAMALRGLSEQWDTDALKSLYDMVRL